MNTEFQVKKSDLAQHRTVQSDIAPLQDGEVRLKIDQFAFTANNLTYGATGDTLGYWQFFPPADNDDGSWGILPVWAFADVVESNCADLPVGDRLYGYFPPATLLTMKPQHVSAHNLIDGAAHRQALPPLYNRYSRVLAEPNYNPATDAARILLAPLHVTSFCLYDLLRDQQWYGAEQVVIVSASSKTSLGLAHGLSNDSASPPVIGLTSPANVPFVSSLSLYDQITAYPAVAADVGERATVVVDMAGNASVRAALQDRLGDKLKHYVSVGLTHWEDMGDELAFSQTGPTSNHEMFFAPSYILKRLKDWGPAEFDRQSTAFVAAAATATFEWMSVDDRQGLPALSEVYPLVCAGSISPAAGLVIKM